MCRALLGLGIDLSSALVPRSFVGKNVGYETGERELSEHRAVLSLPEAARGMGRFLD